MEAAVGRGRFSIVYDSNDGSQYPEIMQKAFKVNGRELKICSDRNSVQFQPPESLRALQMFARSHSQDT